MTTPEAAQLEAIDWRELLRAARSLLQPDNGASPSNECIRRAISNAYYAMFHALAASNSGVIVGPPHDDLTAEAWIRVYRGLDHSTARHAFRTHRHKLSTRGDNFAGVFTDLQARRHSADYDPAAAFDAQKAYVQVALAEYACAEYLQADPAERSCIAALTTIDRRRG